jgi:alkanesulfonate monooxygenase SsuD/methylene tetrahydromethanopterin reductase-like flavin-dependent oxidoreductase (luciferase family)
MSIKLGMFAMPVHAPGKDYRTTLREDQESVILADKLGYAEYYIGEHHTSGIETITSPLIFLASLAALTKNIRLGTGVVNLPQMHPVAVASNIAMLDHLLDGRFIFGAGPGTLVSDVEAFGDIPMDVRSRMVRESLDMVHKLWASEPPFELEGEFWNVKIRDKMIPEFRVGWMPKPQQMPGPPMALTMVSPNSASAKAAGAKGWIPISGNFVNRRYLRGHWET